MMYAIRARPGQDEWTWTIYPNDGPAQSGQFSGTRDEVIVRACRRIDNRLDQPPKNLKGSK
jgi:hypothetical protein